LLNLGIGEAVNTAFNAGNDIITGAPKAETVSDITGGDTTATSNATDTVLGTTGVLDTVTDTGEDTVLTGNTTPVGGLAAVTQTPTITTSDDTGSTAVVIPDDLSTVTSATSPTVSIDDLTNVTKVTSPVITGGDDVIDVVDDTDLTPVVTGATTTATTPATTVSTADDDLQTQIDAIVSPEGGKTTSVVTAEDVLSPKTTVTTDEVPAGGLNIIQKTQTEEPVVDAVTGEVKTPTTSSNIPLAGSGIVSGLIKSNLTKSLNKSLAPAKKPAGGLKTALKPVAPVKKAAAPKMDISKLIPIQKAPVKPTAPKGTLTPVTNIAGLTSMLKNKG
jgi:hypothetical protein